MGMKRLSSVLNGEAKKSVESIGESDMFYATALKTLNRDFGNAFTVAYMKTKFLFDKPQLKHNDRISLRNFQQHIISAEFSAAAFQLSYYMVRVNGLPVSSESSRIFNKSSS